MSWFWVFVGLAGGYVVLALYGKYRMLREQFHEEQEAEARRAFEGEPPQDAP